MFGHDIKSDFPVFSKYPNLCYLDSAATCLKPQAVLDYAHQFSATQYANIHRGAYHLSYQATELYEQSRAEVANFINASPEQVVFTSGATDSINMLMRAFDDQDLLKPGDVVVVSIFEHHSNIVPWQELCKKKGASLKYLYDFSEQSLEIIDHRTKMVSITLMSNAIGYKPPIEKVVQRCRQFDVIVIGDAAQYVSHQSIDTQALDVDYLVFSAHKMFGPTGVGVLFGKKERLEQLPPFRFGGDMIEYVTEQHTDYAQVPTRFEAGTPNIEGVVGLAESIRYLARFEVAEVNQYLTELRQYGIEKLRELEYVQIIQSSLDGGQGPVIGFEVEGIHCHDMASILDSEQIAIRAGHHCAAPLIKHLGYQAVNRASFQIYNTKQDIEQLIEGIKKARRIFNR